MGRTERDSSAQEEARPVASGVVAVVGRPNVGKSTLVGRLAGRRGPIVGRTPGLTRRQRAPVILVANKVANLAAELEASELWGLGFGEPYPVSALHGRGSGDLLDRIVELLPPASPALAAPQMPAIALLGRPNVGKSSLFNRLVGEERAIVHAEPGTTRDAVDTVMEFDGRRYRLVDTAGMRRRARTEGVEIPSAARTRAALERADVAVLMVDVMEGAGHQEQRIARAIADAGTGIVLVLNKWDLVEGDDEAKAFARAAIDKLPFIAYAPLVRTSALTGRGAGKLIPKVDEVLEARKRRIPTSELNTFMQEAPQSHHPPRADQRDVRVLYATQAETAPPTMVLFTNGDLQAGWLRYLEHRLRDRYDFTGNPIHFVVRRQERRHGRRAEG